MNSEHEMCQNCKRDIPVQNYRMHTLQCARSVTTCPDCGDPVSKDLLDVHHQQFHSPRECPLCGVSVQAVKLHGHKKNDCPKRTINCRYCSATGIASDMLDHENQCGSIKRTCPECASQICLRDFESHKLHHKNKEEMYRLAEKIPTGGKMEYKAQTLPRASNNPLSASDTNTLLPCEFCEEMVPMFKLLEHQAECVNPSNVRGTSSSTSSSSGILRSHSMYATTSKAGNPPRRIGSEANEVVFRRKPHGRIHPSMDEQSVVDNEEDYLPCEFCGQSFLPDYIMKHQMTCTQNPHPSNFPSRRASTYLSRASSSREARASTEDRSLRPLGSSLSRQGSFTTSSRQRRGESLTRQNSFSRNIYFSQQQKQQQRSSYDYHSPSSAVSTASSIRRASIFDGYSGYAIYSSISQGLDEITYGGRRSRRNSITESSYSRPGDSFALPTLLAIQGATGAASPTTPVSPNPRPTANGHPLSSSSSSSSSKNPFTFPSLDQRQKEPAKKVPSIKRNVSFTGERPVVINDSLEEPVNASRAPSTAPSTAISTVSSTAPSTAPSTVTSTAVSTVVSTAAALLKVPSHERKKKREPPHVKLFEEVTDKLKVLEAKQKREESLEPSPPIPPTRRDSLPPAGGKESFPSLGSLHETKSENRDPIESPLVLPPPALDPQTSLGHHTLKDVTNEIELRHRNSGSGSKASSRAGSKSGSKAGSKRNSLDSKTVQGLAQDLAAECAKAYALMESSLSKLSTDFAVAPFGISPKKKTSRKARAHSTLK